MRSSTLIVWLLVAACVAIDLAMIGELQLRRNEWPEAGGILGLGLVFSQVSLLALWGVFGRWNIVARFVTAIIGLVGVSYLGSFSTDAVTTEAGFWFAFTSLNAALAVVILSACRWAGYELDLARQCTSDAVRPRRASKQFTIWGLLSLMTATGIVLGAVRFAKVPPLGLIALGLFGLIQSTSSCLLLFVAMRVRSWWHAACFAVLLCPTAGFLLFLTGVAPDDIALPIILCVSVQGILTIGAVHILRQAGYFLRRTRTKIDPTASGSPAASELGSEGQADEL